ncbi:MAG: hypothetical protein HY815_22335, partial [Candidatus Riflebacteria bacterium]|nr:hypothetical protein [Candidatus Riflebacteria bacterium]
MNMVVVEDRNPASACSTVKRIPGVPAPGPSRDPGQTLEDRRRPPTGHACPRAVPRWPLLVVAGLVGLFSVACDSRNPLASPGSCQADSRLLGAWRSSLKGESAYWYVGKLEYATGETAPDSLLRFERFERGRGGVRREGGLAFPTTIGGRTYLNILVVPQDRLAEVRRGPWRKELLVQDHGFLLVHYRFVGDGLVIRPVNESVKSELIEAGRVKGTLERWGPDTFTDTSENVARLVATEHDRLFKAEEML